MRKEVPIEKLRRICDPRMLPFETTEEVKPAQGIIGQQRATKSLRFGLGIKDHGFNIYVAGVPGTGRTTAVKAFLEEVAKKEEVPPDWCYVNNFRDSYKPKALRLPPGRGRELQRDMEKLIEGALREIPRAFESDEYAAKREEIVGDLQEHREDLFSQLEERAKKKGLVLQSTPMGLLIIPMVKGKPLSDQEFKALSKEEQEKLRQKRERVEEELKVAMKQARKLEKGIRERLQGIDREVALYAVSPSIEELMEKYEALPEVVAYLKDVQDDIVENFDQFREEEEARPTLPLPVPWMEGLPFRKYQVNVVVDNSDLQGAPVITELNPTYHNLFGRMEKETQLGALVTDFTLIKGGSLHKANGGYLVLNVEDVLRNYFSWDGLKRAIRNTEITMEEVGERLGLIATKSLMPEPIPLKVKVVLIGNSLIYHLLYNWDEDFNELFKVKADFDIRMDWTEEGVRDYASFICTLCQKENLKHFERGAAAKLVEHASRLAEDQEKLSTRFADIADIMREANFWATEEDSPYVTAAHVDKAIDEKIYRSSRIQELVQEMIERGTIIIDAAGEAIGQVNGLSVIDLGDFAFGRPVRITASLGMGREGVVDIEREAKLGGPIHTKGILILSGYLSEKYAQNMPLSLAARLVFEQSYEEVSGDSASSAELYALLSNLAGLPVKQGIAVTGSINQKGEIQAVGGVNEKIEGFFDICQAKGLTGDQGVIIPESNVQNLMLREEVVEAVKAGKFHIYPLKTIDEGIEILTGAKAGQRQADGSFEKETVNARVEERLRKLAEELKEFGKEEEGEGDS